MAIVRIAIDFFIPRWTNTGGEIWMILQPQVEQQDFAAYVAAINSPRSHTYELAQNRRLGSDPATWPVSINLPSDLNIRLSGKFGAPSQDVWAAPLENDRIKGAILKDPIAFREANSDRSAPQNQDVANALVIAPDRSFVRTYNDGLIQQVNDAAGTPDGLRSVREFVDMGMSGGVIRYLPKGAVTELQRLTIMDLTRTDGSAPNEHLATNLHSLLGLAFKIGDKADLAKLSQIRELTLALISGAGQTIASLDLHKGAEGARFVTTFFGSLTGMKSDHSVTAALTPDLSQRIYADNAGILMSLAGPPANGKPGMLYVAPRGRADNPAKPLIPSRLVRIGARIARSIEKEEEAAALEAEMTAIGDLSWSPHLSIPGVLSPYRQAPVAEHVAGKGTQVLRFVPDAASARRLLELSPLKETLAAAILQVAEQIGTNAAVPNAPEFLGVYDFPWDSDDRDVPTLLYYGSKDLAGRSAVLYAPVLDGANKVYSFVTPMAGLRARSDPFGPRWELPIGKPLAGGFPNKPFDALLLNTAAGANKVAPAAYLSDAFDFWPAQSASRTEFVLKASYPKVEDVDHGAGNTAAIEFDDDLINYNTINCVLDGRWANPHSEIYPAYEGEAARRRLHTFQIGFTHKVGFEHKQPDASAGPPPTPNQLADQIRNHVWKVYDELSRNVRLEATLEHTYGVELDINPKPRLDASRAADWPVALASNVSTTSGEEKNTVTHHFLSITTDWNANGGLGRATLKFETSLLKGMLPNGTAAPGPAVEAAWRSVAELAYADEALLVVDCKRFDWGEGLKNSNLATIGDAVVPNATRHVFLAAVKAAARQAFNNPDALAPAFNVDLPAIDGKAIAKSAHLVAFHLKIIRAGNRYLRISEPGVVRFLRQPGAGGGWVGPEGTNVEAAPEALASCQTWLNDLAGGQGSIQPANIGLAEAGAVRTFLGGSDKWVVPKGLAEQRRGDIVPTLMQMGYRPIARDSYFADASAAVLDRALAAIAEAIDCSARGWETWPSAEWRKHFDTVAAGARLFEDLAWKLADLVAPQPAVRAPGSPARRPRSVERLLGAYASGGAAPERDRLVRRLKREIVAQPTRFSTAKAILLTELRGFSAQEGLSPDFFQLRSEKRLPVEAPAGHPQYMVDADRLAFHEAVTAGDKHAFLILAEELDDASYGSTFSMLAFDAGSFEGAIEALDDKPDEANPFVDPIRIKDDIVFHPDGPVRRTTFGPAEPQAAGVVRLASRLPVTAPAVIGALDDVKDALALRVGERIDSNALKTRREIRKDPASKLEVEAVSRLAPRPDQIDIVEAAFAYAIAGDEEEGTAQARFANDSFVLSFAPSSNPSRRAEPWEGLEDGRSWLVKAAAAPSAASVPDLHRALSTEVLKTLGALASPALPVTPASGQTITIGADGTLKIQQQAGDTSIRYAALLKSETDGRDGAAGRSGHILIIVAAFPLWEQAPTWERNVLRLTHQRNIIGAEPVFAPGFGMANRAAPIDPGLLTPIVDLQDTPPKASQRNLTAGDLIHSNLGVLLTHGTNDWRQFDVAITVSQRLDRQLFTARGAAEAQTLASYSKIALFMRRIGASGLTPNAPFQLDQRLDWFPDEGGMKHFVCDFTWYSRTSNAPVLIVRNLRINTL